MVPSTYGKNVGGGVSRADLEKHAWLDEKIYKKNGIGMTLSQQTITARVWCSFRA